MRTIPTTNVPTRRKPLFRWVGCVSHRALVVAVAVTLAVAGCKQIDKITKPNEKQEFLEAELRTREREVLELRAENAQLKQLTDIYQRQGGHDVITGPVAMPTGMTTTATPLVSTMTLGTGTGGRDDDGRPGDETLQVVIVPKDLDGTAIKVPGKATVTAFEITKEGVKLPIGKWDVAGEDIRRSWKGGLLGGGYHVPLQWDQAPMSDKIRVAVKFTTNDGRSYEADKDVYVKPLPGIMNKSSGPIPLEMPTVISGPVTVIPPVGQPLDTGVLPTPGTMLPMPEFPRK
jgi:hypothetical protein